jgi:hypothetical protein
MGVLSNPKEALENIDPDDYMNSNGVNKKHFFASHSLNCNEHEEVGDSPKRKRTILDGIQNKHFKKTEEVWDDRKI